MKNKVSAFCIFLIVLSSASCKKESPFNIVGQWMSVSIYTMQDNGTYNWMSTNGHPQFYSFSAEGEFGSWTDTPGGGGKYIYDSELQNLILNYQDDIYGRTASTQILKIEKLTKSSLIISYLYQSGFEYKMEFSKLNY